MEDLYSSFSAKARDQVTAFLTRLGYEERVWIDEFQAYYNTEKPSFFGVKEVGASMTLKEAKRKESDGMMMMGGGGKGKGRDDFSGKGGKGKRR